MDLVWERFWRKVEVIPGGCWLWHAGQFSNGYGMFALGGSPRRNASAHRFCYEHYRGTIPEGKDLDHLCRIRHCVNPEHLEPVTRSENLLRSSLMGQSQTEKTHCPSGHSYEGENLYVYKGKRHCRECRRHTKRTLRADPSYMMRERAKNAQYHRDARMRARGGAPAVPNETKTHCPQGHPYLGENLYSTPHGGRQCKACRRLRRGKLP